MKIMIVGSGGREHALAWKLSQSPQVEGILCTPGNGGTAVVPNCRNVEAFEGQDQLSCAKEEGVDLAVIGPELPLIEGTADILRNAGIPTVGPGKAGAALEGSKIGAKNFMRRNGIRTAESRRFDRSGYEEAVEYLRGAKYPQVIKADGPAAGKGVTVCGSQEEAVAVIEELFLRDGLGESGRSVLIEQYLEGREASLLFLCDGRRAVPMVSAMDHKRAGDNDTGPNTGGMGVVVPNPYFTEEYRRDFEASVLKPTLEGLRREGIDFRGVLFFGLMLVGGKNYLLEYNVRFGDPETQALLPLLEDDLAPLLLEVAEGRLRERRLRYRGGASCNVVLASGGYPGPYSTGFPITIEGGIEANNGVSEIAGKSLSIFMAGAELCGGGEGLLTRGGRVLSVTGVGKRPEDARRIAYGALTRIRFEGRYYRSDIGMTAGVPAEELSRFSEM